MSKNRKFTALTLIFTLIASTFLAAPLNVDARQSKKSTSKKHRVHKKSSRKGASKRKSKSKRKRATRIRAPHQLGILIQSEDGTVIQDKLSDKCFNPASAIKLLTAYGALKTFGPTHQFNTDLYMDGDLDTANGVLQGNVYIQGNDPEFGKADSVDLLKALADNGVKKIEGKLIVSNSFSLYCSNSALYSGKGLSKIFRYGGGPDQSIIVVGPVEVGTAPQSAQLVTTHQSEELRSTLKHMLSRSLNNAAERIGSVIGGVPKLRKIAVEDIGIPQDSITITSASGLGQNRISPKHMMQVLKALETELDRYNMDFQNIMPVAGIDNGTLEKRFTGESEKGSVVAKTGTLTTTDGGVSALVGVMRSQKEDLYFVIFGWHGGVHSMRKNQDVLIRQLQEARGGPRAFDYNS